MTRAVVSCGMIASLLCGASSTLAAQQTTAQPIAQPTAVATVPESHPARAVDAVLARLITVDLDRVPLRQALARVAVRGNVKLQYQYEMLDASGVVVTLHVKETALGSVFAQILSETALQLVPLDATTFVIVRTGRRQDALANGIITGTVRDAQTKAPIVGATVTVDDVKRGVLTMNDGTFRLVNVPAGVHTVTAKILGHLRQARQVTVRDDEPATLDFALESSAHTLDQVVVTATGDQRVRELGHVVAVINADSVVREAPITSLSDLLTARVPGLQVLTGSGGVVGGDVALRLRGQTSLSLNSEPVIIVDGVRFKSNNFIDNRDADTRATGLDATMPSPLNDLNPNDIETVEVVKGPSASTLYGPDAANGVIVITTKRGKPGKTEFQWYARPVTNSVPQNRLPQYRYQAWSHDPVTNAPLQGNCTLIYQYYNHYCVLDSLTVVPTQTSDPQQSVFEKDRPTWLYGASVGGGTAALRYALSSNVTDQVGVLRLSPVAEGVLKQLMGVTALPGSLRNPNVLHTLSLHTNISSDVTSRLSFTVSGGYMQSNQRRVSLSNFFANQMNYGPRPNGDTTAQSFANYDITTTNEGSDRLLGSVQGNAQITSWLSVNALVGTDVSGIVTHALHPSDVLSLSDQGSVEDDRRNSKNQTINLGMTANAKPGRFSFRTSTGVQYTYEHLDGVSTKGDNLPVAGNSIGQALTVTSGQVWNESASLGVFGEEVVGLNDRLYVTGSLRLDGSTSFGDEYEPHPYPKVGVSWIASEEPLLRDVPGLHTLRFRYSFGSASRYPTASMKTGFIVGSTGRLGGQDVHVFGYNILSNSELRPERTRESEYGVDATILSNIDISLTRYARRTLDQLLLVDNPTGMGRRWANTASLTAQGFEATVNVPVLNTSHVQGDLSFSYSYNTDRVLSLGAASDFRCTCTGYSVGYPTNAIFTHRILGVVDTVGTGAGNPPDGIVFPQEVVRDTALRFLGVIDPPKTYQVTPSITLFHGLVHVTSAFDRQTGFYVFDSFARGCTDSGLCAAPFLTTTPLLEQARYASYPRADDFFFPGDFTRWREFNVTLAVPQRFLRFDPIHLRFHNASVSIQGRNLKLWTAYRGTDPESRTQTFGDGFANGIPQTRAWSMRFDLTP